MIRPVVTEIGIFLIPFAIYAAWLIVNRAGVFAHSSWPSPVVGRLAVVALALTIISLVLLAHFSGAPPGATYTPARVDENGHFVPGSEK